MIMGLILIGGALSYWQMGRERYPDVTVDVIVISTFMSGASPKEIEQLLTIPLEEQIAKIDEIDQMTSISADGISSIFVELESSVDNVFEKLTQVQNQIELVQNFPDEADNPVVIEARIPFHTLTLSIVGFAPEHEIKAFADDLEAELNLIKGVEEVTITGLREREIWIECDPDRLHAYGLSLTQVSAALRRRNLNLPGGLVRMGRGEFTVRTEAEFNNIREIADTILKEDGENGYVYLRDVAEVRDTFEEHRTLARLDGEASVNILIDKADGSNAITLVEEVRAKVEQMTAVMPAGLSIKYVDDSSIEIRNRLKGLYQNLGLGLVLVIISFTFFIGLRPGLMVALGIPVALAATLIFVNWYGYSINTIVLFSMILVLGLLVDDAIVVCENVYRHVEAGMPIHEAAIKGTEEITWPVVATVLTTVAAFLPLLLMTGVLGKFMGIIPVVVTLALIASLIECLLILPVHIVEWGGLADKTGKHEVRPWLEFLTSRYQKVMSVCLRMRYVVVAATIGIAIFAFNVAYTRMDFILFGGRDLQRFTLELESPSGASLFETARILEEIEKRVDEIRDDLPELKNYYTNIGRMERGFGSVSASNLGQIFFELVSLEDRDRSGQEVKNQIRDVLGDITGHRTLTFEDARDGPPVGKAVQVRIKGDNFDTLKVISTEVQDFLHTIGGVKDIMDNFPPGKDEVRPRLDLEKVAALGLDVRTIATEIRGAFDGIEATTVHDGKDEIEVMVKYSEKYRRSLDTMEEMHFATPAGMVPFSNFGRMERVRGFSQISHHEQVRSINVLADIDETWVGPGGRKMTSVRANQQIMEEFEDIGLRYPGYTLDFGGEFEDTRESLASMVRAFAITIVLIYVILGGLFKSFLQPFIVMFSVPFSFVGVIWGFFVLDEPLGMFSIIGIIALSGIVVNDALILIEFINSRRRVGVARRRSILEAGAARLRPIILTSITTILGLSPMAIGLFGVDPLMRPMALAIVLGLTFATVLTLIVIPAVYGVFDDYSMLVLRHPLGLTRAQWREILADKERRRGHAPEAHESTTDSSPDLGHAPEPAVAPAQAVQIDPESVV